MDRSEHIFWGYSCLHTPTPTPAPANGGGARVIAGWDEASLNPNRGNRLLGITTLRVVHHQPAVFCSTLKINAQSILPSPKSTHKYGNLAGTIPSPALRGKARMGVMRSIWGRIWMLSCLHTPTPTPAPASGGGARVIAGWDETSPNPNRGNRLLGITTLRVAHHQPAVFCSTLKINAQSILPSPKSTHKYGNLAGTIPSPALRGKARMGVMRSIWGRIWMLSCLHTPTPTPAPASGGGARVIAGWGEHCRPQQGKPVAGDYDLARCAPSTCGFL